jgi:hypothetical protein
MMRIQRPGQRIITIGNPGLSISSPRGGAAASWWLAGGVSAANCIAAYQAKGVASYAASKVNLANPGTYDATDNTAPAWDTSTGWTFNGVTNSRYLTIAYASTALHSIIIRLSGISASKSRVIASAGYANLHIYPGYIDGKVYLRGYSSSGVSVSTVYTQGVFCVVPGGGYIDGVSAGTYSHDASGDITSFEIGRYNQYYWEGNILALAVYKATLTADQVAAITTVMNAL